MAASLPIAAASAFADVQPAATSAATRQAIQAAIDAAPTGGTVTLSAGTFGIDAQLMVTNGNSTSGSGGDRRFSAPTRSAMILPYHASDTRANRSYNCRGVPRCERIPPRRTQPVPQGRNEGAADRPERTYPKGTRPT